MLTWMVFEPSILTALGEVKLTQEPAAFSQPTDLGADFDRLQASNPDHTKLRALCHANCKAHVGVS